MTDHTLLERLGPLRSIPDWKLSHILGDTAVEGVKWSDLTQEQRFNLLDEIDRRKQARGMADPVPTPTNDSEGAQVPDDELGDGVNPDLDDTVDMDTTPGPVSTVNSDDAKELIALADTAAELDVLEADERNSVRHNGGRKGVLDAIAKRRAELEPQP